MIVTDDLDFARCLRYLRDRHLLNVDEILGIRLLTIHNLHFYLTLMKTMREAIANDCLNDLEGLFTS